MECGKNSNQNGLRSKFNYLTGSQRFGLGGKMGFNQQALEPKKVVLVPSEHFAVYTGRGLALSSQAALAWFRQWLMP